jgi:hypothetical protein
MATKPIQSGSIADKTTMFTCVVAFHRPVRLPDDPAYLPVLVGDSECSGKYIRDNTGKNITEKNPWYSELTALYWAWKNLDAEYLGLAHYRRYFALSSFHLSNERKWGGILSAEQAALILGKHSIILPRLRHYYITSKYNHFASAHGEAALIAARRVILERYPNYMPAWNTTMARSSGHIFNMFIMRRDILNAYCTWLFDVLFATEDALHKMSGGVAPRLMGYLGERLLDVWLELHKPPYVELPVINMERINWPSKIIAFLQRTLWGRRRRTEDEGDKVSAASPGPATGTSSRTERGGL